MEVPWRALGLGMLVAVGALVLLAAAAAADGANLAYNGDFELESDLRPPPGWTMWGAQQYKDPANYTRDTANPHGGKACFRIHHPADTAGYIVTASDRAIRPGAGRIYTVAFWARMDKPGASQFGFTAYESIAPYLDAPTPGFFTFEAGSEWTQHVFSVREGLDLHAGRSRYLLLTFRATLDSGEAKTLWIDDVVVTEEVDPEPVRLLDEARLEYEPLQHRLRPGDALEITVDASRRWRRATRDAGGVSFHRVAGWTGQPYDKQGEYTLLPELEAAMGDLRLPMTRFYAVGDEPFGIEASIDKAAEMVGRIGVPQDHTVLEFETQGAATKLPPDEWAVGVRHSLARGYKFRHWEVANEPYSGMWGHGGAYPTSDDYVAQVKAVSAAIRDLQPEAQIGVAINRGSTRWCSYLLQRAAGAYDFVVGHYYAVRDAHRRKFEVAVLTENYKVLDSILRINALIRAYNPGREVYQYDTEWGMHSGGANGERADYVDRNANIMGTLHRAVRLIYYAREGMLRGASSWQMFSALRGQGFGILSQQAPDKRFMIYWLYYYFNRHVGEWALETDGTAPYYTPAEGDDPYTKPEESAGPLTPVLVTLSDDGGALYLVAANGSWDRAVPCRVHLRNFAAAKATGTVLSHGDLDGRPLLERKEDFVGDLPVVVEGGDMSCTLPAHSVVFVTLERG